MTIIATFFSKAVEVCYSQLVKIKLVDKRLHVCLIVLVIIYGTFHRWPGKKLSHIPAIGFQGHFLSFLSSLEYYFNNKSLVERGCAKYHNGIFKIPTFSRWKVVVHDTKYVEDMRNAPDNVLSMKDSVNEILQIPYTLGPSVAYNSYHVPLVRTLLTRNLPRFFPEIQEEIVTAFSDAIPASSENGWVKCKPLDIVPSIISRSSNRVFVGQSLCRDQDFISTCVKYAASAVNASIVLNLTPSFLKPFVSRRLRNIPASVEQVVQHLRPTMEERFQNISAHGKDYPGKPDDMLSWLIDEAKGEERELRHLAIRILALNFAAIHTASMTFSHTLLWLAAYPEYAGPMREELQEVLDREGWTHSALAQMTRIDSFIRETMRFTPLTSTLLERTCRQPFQFSDGTLVPKGSVITAAVGHLHFDEKVYEDPYEFRPFRFASLEEQDTPGRKADIVSVGSGFLPFGYGRHACPGRFLASAEMKTMLAHILMTYDVKLEDGSSGRPKDLWFAVACLPNPKAYILFRKRTCQ